MRCPLDFARGVCWTAAVASALAFAPGVALPAAAEPVELPLQHLTLYSSGVGYFEHGGAVPDGGAVTLDFTTEQLNDVLKSLLVRGATGSVAVSYPGQEPVAQRLAGFGINLAKNTTLLDLIKQLRGVRISVTLVGDTQPVAGRVVNVFTRQRVVGTPPAKINETVVTLATAAGLRPVTLEQVENLRIEDAGLQQELDKALTLLGSTRDRDAKPVTLTFDKASDRMAVSYLLGMPLWKVSYRLDLTADEPLLQGWAVVDNTTDTDWENVAVTLVAGRPVSFVQDLYSPEFLARPVVRQQRYAGLRPQEYGQGVMLGGELKQQAPSRSARGRASGFGGMASPAAMEADASVMSDEAVPYDELQVYPADWPELTQRRLTASVAPSASAGDLGELFAYTIAQPVTLPRGGSAMLPIVNEAVTAEALSIYNASVQPKHPMRGVRLTNTTDLKLDAGPVTVLDDGVYAGDARIGFLAPGDDRLLSYGLDLELTVDATAKSHTQLLTATISRGVLKLANSTRFEQTYTVRSAAGKDRDVLIEHPRTHGRELQEPKPAEGDGDAAGAGGDTDDADGIEKTDTLYRFPLHVPAGETAELKVVEVQPSMQTVQLARHSADQLVAFAGNGRFPGKVRDALREAARLQRGLEDTRRQIATGEKRVQQITAEQDRIRRNMGSVDRNSSLYKRYITKLDTQETTLEDLGGRLADLRQQQEVQTKALADYLDGLTVE